jgi:alpha-1,2-mannosyltransferase
MLTLLRYPDAGPESDWEEVAALPFVDSARSPPLTRAFYLPGISPKRNAYLRYVLLRRKGHPVT